MLYNVVEGNMTGEQADNSPREERKTLLRIITDKLPLKVTTGISRSPHLWIIVFIILLETFVYYVDQSPWKDIPPLDNAFFSSVHDLHRLLYLIPIVYAAIVFRVRGSLISSFILLCVILPRGLLFSPYPDPLLRALIFVTAATLVGLLVAIQLNRAEKEEETRIQLETAYQQLKESQEQLVQAEKLESLGKLAAAVAHEVNNPISGVLIYIQLLMKNLNAGKLSEEKALNYLKTMELELTRCSQLIRDLLDFSRQAQSSFEQVNLNDVIERALNLVTHSALLEHINIVKELSPALPEVTADANQLQQVFVNLLLNAIQAMPQGGTITLRTCSNDGEIRIDFKDTGVGIPKENISKLFTPFFTTKTEVKGVGLGLAVSYGIIQKHGGKIEVDSEEGKGTIFTIYLIASDGEKR
jgi:signal transduction histidine kinase